MNRVSIVAAASLLSLVLVIAAAWGMAPMLPGATPITGTHGQCQTRADVLYHASNSRYGISLTCNEARLDEQAAR